MCATYARYEDVKYVNQSNMTRVVSTGTEQHFDILFPYSFQYTNSIDDEIKLRNLHTTKRTNYYRLQLTSNSTHNNTPH